MRKRLENGMIPHVQASLELILEKRPPYQNKHTDSMQPQSKKPTKFFTEIEKEVSKIHMELQKIMDNHKTILSEKE